MAGPIEAMDTNPVQDWRGLVFLLFWKLSEGQTFSSYTKCKIQEKKQSDQYSRLFCSHWANRNYWLRHIQKAQKYKSNTYTHTIGNSSKEQMYIFIIHIHILSKLILLIDFTITFLCVFMQVNTYTH